MQTLLDRQTNQLPSGPLASEQGQGALLFSLWFSYYTEINTVELFSDTQGLWRQWARGLNSFICLFAVAFSAQSVSQFHCLWQAGTWCHARIQALLSKHTNTYTRGSCICLEECVQLLIRKWIQQHLTRNASIGGLYFHLCIFFLSMPTSAMWDCTCQTYIYIYIFYS